MTPKPAPDAIFSPVDNLRHGRFLTEALQVQPTTGDAPSRQLWQRAALLLLLALVVLVQPLAAGNLYTWVDGKGTVHINANPPQNGSVVGNVISYQSPQPLQKCASTAQQTQQGAIDKATAALRKKLQRLKKRLDLMETIIAQNHATIEATEKDAAKYRRRSGTYARRNKILIDRQLVMLKNNLAIYQQNLRYVKEEIDETEQSIRQENRQIASEQNKP